MGTTDLVSTTTGGLAARLFVVCASAVLIAPWWGASAVAETAEVGTGNEAWHHRDPTAMLPEEMEEAAGPLAPVRGPVAEATNPYDTDTLHVGVNLGEPEAYTFVSFPLTDLDPGGQVVVRGGTVTFTASGLHERAAEQAEMIACAIEAPFGDELGGDWYAAPAFDCHFRSPLVPVADADPLQWTVDLAPFAGLWELPFQNHGIAIVPDPDSELPLPQQSWHVAFHAKTYEQRLPVDPPPAPITAVLEYDTEEPEAFDAGTVLPADDFAGDDPAFDSFDTLDAGATGDFPEVALDDGPDDTGDPPEVADADGGADAEEAPGVRRVPLEPVSQSSLPGMLSLVALGLAGLTGYAYSPEGELRMPDRLRRLQLPDGLRRLRPPWPKG